MFIRCSAHVANAFFSSPFVDVQVVALHLGERLLKNQGPNNIALAYLGRPRLFIFEWDVVVDDNGLRHAENEEIDSVATFLEQSLLKHFFHAAAGYSDSCSGCEVVAVANTALYDVGSLDSFYVVFESSSLDRRDATIL